MIVLKASPILKRSKEILARWVHLLARPPVLAVILVGHNSASELYIEKKREMAENLGFGFKLLQYHDACSEKMILRAIDKINNDPNLDGLLIQLPLPKHLNSEKLIAAIHPSKDVDGLHAANQGSLWAHASYHSYFAPCTPLGIIRMLSWYNIPLAGKSVLILGRSQLVGRPLAAMFLHLNARVHIAHSRAPASATLIQQSDIIIVATGSRSSLTWEQLSPHHIVIDVGTHKADDGSYCGDLGPRPETLNIQCYSPVPGGVGPMTVNSLMYNIFKSYCLRSAPNILAEFISTHHTLFEPLL